MLPSIVAQELRTAVRQFLIAAYEPSDAFFAGIVERFVTGDAAVGKGPYLQLGLPFKVGAAGKHFFDGFEIEFPGFAHQEQAWQRLASNRDAANTLVATGTGSGKTECFLYPLLDHCARARAAGAGAGIKALVIYPMNALANDQARRFAAAVAKIPAFKDLRVGMYVGGARGKPGSGKTMQADAVITDRDVLRKAPPDVLLTNYKMLDYLLIRPKDRGLWQHNGPETLRYIVVDELHTFDGAQGTDLAMLLRRLRARLGTPRDHLICVGTSATLGDGDDATLRDYAGKIFDASFAADSVVTEHRDDVATFLGDAPIDDVLQARDDWAEVLDPSHYANHQSAIRAWFGVFFPESPAPADVAGQAWRGELGKKLKGHLLAQNLLRILKNGVEDWETLCHQLAGPMPVQARPHAARVLDALIALLAWSRAADGRPLVSIRVQLWLRELRRLVASVDPSGADVTLAAAADLKADSGRLRLPLVQCSECHATGWLTAKPEQEPRVSADLEVIYNTWFRSASEVVRLYPAEATTHPRCDCISRHLCGQCGNLQSDSGKCLACGNEGLVAVLQVAEQRQTNREGAVFNWHVKVCPACGAKDRLLLLGARNATLGAQVIEQLWASHYNDDRKLIAFSDSVQDAAHRAGFFASRTYQNNTRMAMAQAFDPLADPAIAWPEYLQKLPDYWLGAGGMTPEVFVTEFIGPDMQWQQDWEYLQDKGALPADGELLQRVRKRLAWQAVAEFTYLSRRGRTLDRLGVACLSLPADALDALVPSLTATLHEKFGVRSLQAATVLQWLWGFLIHLRQRGGVTHPEMDTYAGDGNLYGWLRSRGRDFWLPGMHPRSPHPALLSLGRHRDFDALDRRDGWYPRWLQACFGRDAVLLPAHGETGIYLVAIESLIAAHVLGATEGAQGRSVALAAESLALYRDNVQLAASRGRHRLTVPRALADRLLCMPCLDAMDVAFDRVEEVGSRVNVFARRFREGRIRRVLAAEHTGLLEREPREALEQRFKARPPAVRPWFENLLSATPTLEMGVDIGDLSSVLLCSVPPAQANYLQRSGRAGRRDGNAVVTTLASGASPHDLYFYAQPLEMMAGRVNPPGVFLEAAEVLRRQLFAFCIDGWIASGVPDTALPDKAGPVLDAVQTDDHKRFPYTFMDWVHAREDALLERFMALLGANAVERVRNRLAAYLHGDGDQDGLRIGLVKLLEEQVKERAALRARADAVKHQIEALKAQPQDDATRAKLDELGHLREGSLAQMRALNAAQLLQTLTDAGLIPNYAFPEAGIELKSILWRKRVGHEQGAGQFVSLPIETYERPAASALSEFAPENRFYANRRRVQINQIALDQAEVETWRFCPSCSHAGNLTAGDPHDACPRCGSVMWANVTQKRTLLRFRKAMARGEDKDTRIDDSSEDREPRFFLRQLLVDVAPDQVTTAWQLESDSVAFGFEFVRRVRFLDINFGERGKAGDVFKVADREASRPGFKLCRHCGMVQTPPRPARRDSASPPPAQRHTRDCKAWGGNDPADLFDCLYLYREFESEAVRVLVPFTHSGNDETELQSFMAALHLGLKQRFGGRVDHLRITDQEEPGGEDGIRRHYVLLYDSVPGGTGYLQQLLSEEAQTLTEVVTHAYHALTTCPCNADPEKDGCYQCLYQYRQGRVMDQVSRRVATAILAGLVNNFEQMRKVKSISDVYTNPQLESVLEARFVESLHRLGGVAGLPIIRVIQDVVDGKPGWLLEVGAERYWLRPQVDLNPDGGVAVASRPDFLVMPVRARSARLPVAVFADGWAYHADRLRDDARKRSALAASGRYRVWSVTWDDVTHALSGRADGGAGLPDEHARPDARPVADGVQQALGIQLGPNADNAVASLLRWLALPDGAEAAALDRQRRIAFATLAELAVHPQAPDRGRVADLMTRLTQALPAGSAECDPGDAWSCSREPVGVCAVVADWPQAFTRCEFDGGFGAVWLRPPATQPDAALKTAWREWLAWFNVLQFLPNMFLVEDTGLAHGDYAGLGPAAAASATEPGDAAWNEVLQSALADVREGLQHIRAQGLPPPDEVGYELEAAGEVVAEAELAWLAAQLVVVLGEKLPAQAVWTKAGWRLVSSGDPEWAANVVAWLKERI